MKAGEVSLSEISTRIWLDEALWHKVRSRAISEGTTIRELVPRLIGQMLGESPASTRPSTMSPPSYAGQAPAAEAGTSLPVVVLSELYRCGVCGAEVKVGGLTIHMGKHVKEQRANDGERS